MGEWKQLDKQTNKYLLQNCVINNFFFLYLFAVQVVKL